MRTNDKGREWSELGDYPNLNDATGRVLEQEGNRLGSLFLRTYVDPLFGTSEAAILSRLEYQVVKGFLSADAPGAVMWELSMSNAAKEWIMVGTFDTVTVARRIRQIEGRASGGIFLEMHVEIDSSTDEDAFSVLHHTGRSALYGIRCRKN
jgi:hypothetical protein